MNECNPIRVGIKHLRVPSIEDIVECSVELDLVRTYKKGRFGEYDPQHSKVRFNPKLIASKDEFVLTILHEYVHHLDIFDELDELQTELLAEYLQSNKAIRTYLERYFNKEVKTYWSKR